MSTKAAMAKGSEVMESNEGHESRYEMLEMLEATPTQCCTQCSHQTVWKFQLDHHTQRIHGNVYATELFRVDVEPELYSCASCTFKNSHKRALYEHCLRKHGAGNYKKENVSGDSLDEKFEIYQCDDCKHIGHSKLSFAKHLDSCETELKHPIELVTLPGTSRMDSEIDSEVRGRKRRPCATFQNDFQCCHCSYKGRTKSQLKNHMRIRHTVAAEITEITWFNCTQCSYRSKRPCNLNRHMVTHAADDEIVWFNCPECSYRGKRKERLKRHMMVHAKPDDANINWVSCNKCSYRTKRHRHLRDHLLTHATTDDDIKWLNCTQCSYRSRKQGNLKRHMLTHATEDEITWFNCTECSYRAKENQQFKRHMITHATDDNVKWFQCEHCSYRAKRQEYVKRHTLMHAQANYIDGQFHCEKCSYRTKSPGVFKRHELSHIVARPVSVLNCTQCSYSSKWQGNLDRHMRTHVAHDNDMIDMGNKHGL